MLTAGPNQAPPDGKHVPSMAPGGPRDLSKDLARQRQGSDARLTQPPGGYPETVGKDPGDPSISPSRQMPDDPLTAAEPAAYSVGNSYHAGMRANY
jgi:hypothetical protein